MAGRPCACATIVVARLSYDKYQWVPPTPLVLTNLSSQYVLQLPHFHSVITVPL